MPKFKKHNGDPSQEALEILQNLRKRVRLAEFDGQMMNQAQRLRGYLKELRQGSLEAIDLSHDDSTFAKSAQLNYLKALGTLSEIYDFYGEYRAAREVISREANSLLSRSEAWIVPRDDEDRALLKQCVWTLLHYSQVAPYREHRYAESRDITIRCQKIVERLLCDKEHPHYFTRARICYMLGQTYRQLQQYEPSRQAFVECLRLSCLNLDLLAGGPGFERKAEELKDEDRRRQEQALAIRSIALALSLGLGFLTYNQGLLREAESLIMAARALLVSSSLLFSSKEWLHIGYVELLYGCVQRSMAGYDPEKLAKAIAIVEKAYQEFAEQGHDRYQARAAWELALGYLYSAKYTEAEDYAQKVLRIAEKKDDIRWQCNALIVQSRIHRRRGASFEKAAQKAEVALKKAVESGQLACTIEALIARGEARLEMGQWREARVDFSDALKLAETNVKTRAVCHLHLSETYLKEDDLRAAERHFSEWEKLESRVEHALIRSLARQVRNEIELRQEDFRIPRGEKNLNVNEHAERLRIHLLKQAKRQYRTIGEVAEALGVTRQTVHNWLKHAST